MEDKPSPAPDAGVAGAPEPEVLKPRDEDAAGVPAPPPLPKPEEAAKRRRRTYRPSHKATFIALAVVVAILAVNAVILGFVLKNKAKDDKANAGQVTISADVLSKIGVNRDSIGNSGVLLTVDPDAQFNGKVQVAGDVNVTGQFKLGSKLVAGEAAIARLESGDTSLTQLNVSGKTTLSDLVLRNGLSTTGATQLQGAVTIGQLLTVNNSANILGNLSVGGTFTAATFSANSLTSTSTLTIGGHIISAGSAPNVGGGGAALGSNGTVNISGNDTAGRIGINIGVGAVAGTLVNVAFRTQYGITPKIVISAVGFGNTIYISSISTAGFSVAVTSGMSIGGYAINYIVVQ